MTVALIIVLAVAGLMVAALAVVVYLGAVTSALTVATWSGRRMDPGDLVFLEISGVVRRYGAALMRSVAIGKIADEFERRNDIVHEVLATTMAAIRPGVTSDSVNSACAAAFAEGHAKRSSAVLLRRHYLHGPEARADRALYMGIRFGRIDYTWAAAHR